MKRIAIVSDIYAKSFLKFYLTSPELPPISELSLYPFQAVANPSFPDLSEKTCQMFAAFVLRYGLMFLACCVEVNLKYVSDSKERLP